VISKRCAKAGSSGSIGSTTSRKSLGRIDLGLDRQRPEFFLSDSQSRGTSEMDRCKNSQVMVQSLLVEIHAGATAARAGATAQKKWVGRDTKWASRCTN
jgi:hypothetical protein